MKRAADLGSDEDESQDEGDDQNDGDAMDDETGKGKRSNGINGKSDKGKGRVSSIFSSILTTWTHQSPLTNLASFTPLDPPRSSSS
jgi:hypothetical protein